jgi:methylenetetrahydrofolate dehydrogenase (NADP+)/methenyltetrahydrofolate cyclohydrolase
MNEDANIHGIIVQLPLPPHISKAKVIEAVDSSKDIDGITSLNMGNL